MKRSIYKFKTGIWTRDIKITSYGSNHCTGLHSQATYNSRIEESNTSTVFLRQFLLFFQNGADVINQFKSSIAMLSWNKALWLVQNSRGTWNRHSEYLISVHRSYTTLNFVYTISSSRLVDRLFFNVRSTFWQKSELLSFYVLRRRRLFTIQKRRSIRRGQIIYVFGRSHSAKRHTLSPLVRVCPLSGPPPPPRSSRDPIINSEQQKSPECRHITSAQK